MSLIVAIKISPIGTVFYGNVIANVTVNVCMNNNNILLEGFQYRKNNNLVTELMPGSGN